MAVGLYQDAFTVERSLASVTATTVGNVYIAPFDVIVLGAIISVGTAPGATHAVSINVQDTPTSQTGGGGTTVNAYNLWTTANAPSISGTATNNITVVQSDVFYGAGDLVKNAPYALNYPLPGPSGTTGYETAQATSQITQTPVVSPPLEYNFGIAALVAPDNTYTDYNGNTAVPASLVHAGDVLQVSAVGSSLGSSANLNVELVLVKA